MRKWVKGTAPAALLALAAMSLGSGTAFADTDGQHSVGGGNQVNAPVTLPIDISGNAAAVGGNSTAVSQGGSSVTGKGGQGGNTTSGKSSVLGGNQVNAPVTAPVNACGNAVSVIGNSKAACRGGASVVRQGRGGGGAGGNRTDGTSSVLGGNQVVAPITAPVNACGNAVAIFGGAVAGCRGGASVTGAPGRGAGGNTTSGRSSVLGGNQVVAPVTAPANVCGLAVGAVGNAFSGCKGGAVVPGAPKRPTTGYAGTGRPGAGGNRTDGTSSVVGGNQVVAPVTAPVNVCGTAIAAVGNAAAGCVGGSSINGFGPGRGAGGNTTSGRSGVVSGNQAVAPVTAPVNVCGTAVAAVGNAFGACRGGSSVNGGYGRGAGGNTTSGRSGVLAGNQVVAPVTAPVNACGNAVAALGDAAAGCLGGARVGGPAPVTRVPAGAREVWQSYGKGNLPQPPAAPPVSTPRSGLLSSLPTIPLLETIKGLPSRTGLTGLPVLPKVPLGSASGERSRPVSVGVVDGLLNRGGLVGLTRGAQSAPQLAPQAVTKGLPVVGLMSAAQPVGVTGMNSGSLFSLLLGAMAAASAALFVTARRIRFAKK
ncbi:chaplin family protein [Streptosporangium saharense]|uniref:chaplin family protein n=1 Tax=Streptosporangium saharense TaxID=1706840 RepID=UPI00369754B9